MTMDLNKIKNNLVKSVASGEDVKLESFWEKQTCVILFMRRFGWPTCRLHIKEVSTIHPRLEANNIRFVGIGVEELGVEDFVKGGFFPGELYIDTKKQCYKDLGLKRLNIFSGIGAIFAKTTRDGLAKAKEQNIDGNMKGDGFQNGGALVVKAGGKEVIYSYKQEDPGLYVQPNDILKALGLEETKEAPKVEEASGGGWS